MGFSYPPAATRSHHPTIISVLVNWLPVIIYCLMIYNLMEAACYDASAPGVSHLIGLFVASLLLICYLRASSHETLAQNFHLMSGTKSLLYIAFTYSITAMLSCDLYESFVFPFTAIFATMAGYMVFDILSAYPTTNEFMHVATGTGVEFMHVAAGTGV